MPNPSEPFEDNITGGSVESGTLETDSKGVPSDGLTNQSAHPGKVPAQLNEEAATDKPMPDPALATAQDVRVPDIQRVSQLPQVRDPEPTPSVPIDTIFEKDMPPTGLGEDRSVGKHEGLTITQGHMAEFHQMEGLETTEGHTRSSQVRNSKLPQTSQKFDSIVAMHPVQREDGRAHETFGPNQPHVSAFPDEQKSTHNELDLASEASTVVTPLHPSPHVVLQTNVAGTSTSAASTSIQRQFCEKLLDTFNNRRSAVDNRTYVIGTIGLAFFGFLLTQGDTVFADFQPETRHVCLALLLVPSFASIAYCLSLITPLRRPRRRRKAKEHSLSWFYLIPDQPLLEYEAQINKLTDADLTRETIRQVYEIAGVLKIRYDRLRLACIYLETAVILFFLMLITKYVWFIWREGF